LESSGGIELCDKGKRIEAIQTLCQSLLTQDWDTVRKLFAPDAILVEGAMRAVNPEAKVRFNGIEEIIEFFRQETAQADGFVLRPIDFMEDGDRVAMFWESTRQATKGIERSRGLDVFTFSGNRIVLGRVYLDLAPEA